MTDAHLHLWDLAASPYAWLDSAPAGLRRTLAWEDARPLVASLGATRVILVQADDTRADTEHLQRTAGRIERGDDAVDRADVVAWMPLEDPGQVERLLDDRAAMAHVVGVRHLVHGEPDPGFLERDAVAASLARIAAAGLALDVPDAHPRHMAQVARLAESHPDLTIVMDHVGKPPLGDASAMSDWSRELSRIAAAPTTVAKISGLSTSGDGRYTDAVALAVDLFGPERCLFGSDWPIAPHPMDAGPARGLCEHIQQRYPDDAVQILSRTAERVYRRLGE
ncbi:MAG: amidohydrolase family protein [Brachybacterium sp.]|nr:amidohydrolase family protein [Brachybacterium sp.]